MQLNAETDEVFMAECEELCDLLDKDAPRGAVYARWLAGTLAADDGAVLRRAGSDGRRLLEDRGLGAICQEKPFELPFEMARLGGAASTFLAARGHAQTVGVFDVVLVGCLLPLMALRGRAREALTEEHLEAVDTVLTLVTHVLTHWKRGCEGESGVGERHAADIKLCIAALLDVLDDALESTSSLCTHLIAMLLVLSPDRSLYGDVQVHRNANNFGVQFVSLINRQSFQRCGGQGDDDLLDVTLAGRIIEMESAAAQQAHPSSVLFPRDLAVLAEVLVREIRDNGASSPRSKSYRGLLNTIATSSLKPVECHVDFSEYM